VVTPRVAFFGGTFDPPHRGHVAIARAAADHLALDRVLFAPVGSQPLKPGLRSSSYADRLAMVRLVCREDPRFEASTIDAPREDGRPNYTVDTLSRLITQLPDAKIFGLSGADSFLTLRQWHQPDRLLELAEWIVVSRPGFPLRSLDDPGSTLSLTDEQRRRIHLLETVHEDISASELRRRLSLGESTEHFISKEIAQYIAEHSLYRAV